MKYLSVCSGIEAASVAWHPLGWQPAAFAEIEKFPSAVLAHHYPHVPNFGDMTKFKDWPDADVDVLVGGTPCQSFSVAGLRKGMADPRGNLALTYLAIADRYRPEWLLWENVPGVLSSSGGRDFGAFLGGLAELGYGFAYRVLDAQYMRVDGFGRAVPQRRRRVFVVGNSGDWRRAAAVLFERESLSWDSAPSRQAGERVAPTISARPSGGGGLGTDFDCDGGLVADTLRNHPRPGSNSVGATVAVPAISHCLNAGGMGRIDYETETMIAHSLRGEGFDASEDGTGRGTPLVPIAFSCKDSGGDASFDVSPTLRAGGFTNSHANAGVMPAVAFGIRSDASRDGEAKTPSADAEGRIRLRNPGLGIYSEIAPTIDAGQPHSVAFDMRGREGGAQFEGPHDTANIRAASGGSSRSYVAQTWAVRRLTPTECERLQGFTDDYTNVPWRGKNGAPDGPRYKALGNSMAVNAMRWIGQRIAKTAALTETPSPQDQSDADHQLLRGR